MSKQESIKVRGFKFSARSAGIKKSGKPDMALIYSEVPACCAGVFTTNKVVAAPVVVSAPRIRQGSCQAVVINSGNANACTGEEGLRDALRTGELAAHALGVSEDLVAVSSTGVIGVSLPMEKFERHVPLLAADLQADRAAAVAEAIMTTDAFPKISVSRGKVEDASYTIMGLAKGAGMIHPDMATMLAFMVTDAPVAGRHLRQALRTATDESFNQISVDGDESTNDTAVLLANGAAGGTPIDPQHPDWDAFQGAVTDVCTRLARRIAADGEGATKLIEVRILGARDQRLARLAARNVAASNLVKSAIHGSDPNWGRIVSAIGQTHAPIDPDVVTVKVGDRKALVTVLDKGEVIDNEEAANERLQSPEVVIEVDLAQGDATGTAWGCDLTPDYVTFNAEYTT